MIMILSPARLRARGLQRASPCLGGTGLWGLASGRDVVQLGPNWDIHKPDCFQNNKPSAVLEWCLHGKCTGGCYRLRCEMILYKSWVFPPWHEEWIEFLVRGSSVCPGNSPTATSDAGSKHGETVCAVAWATAHVLGLTSLCCMCVSRSTVMRVHQT